MARQARRYEDGHGCPVPLPSGRSLTAGGRHAVVACGAPGSGLTANGQKPILLLGLNHANQKTERRTRVETIRGPLGPSSTPVHYRPSGLLPSRPPQPPGGKASAAILDPLARSW